LTHTARTQQAAINAIYICACHTVILVEYNIPEPVAVAQTLCGHGADAAHTTGSKFITINAITGNTEAQEVTTVELDTQFEITQGATADKAAGAFHRAVHSLAGCTRTEEPAKAVLRMHQETFIEKTTGTDQLAFDLVTGRAQTHETTITVFLKPLCTDGSDAACSNLRAINLIAAPLESCKLALLEETVGKETLDTEFTETTGPRVGAVNILAGNRVAAVDATRIHAGDLGCKGALEIDAAGAEEATAFELIVSQQHAAG